MNSVKFLIFSLYSIIVSAYRTCPNEQRITNWGVHDDDISTIMYYHLRYRYDALKGRIPGQPQAEYMEMLSWDYRLAKHAQKIANKCEFTISTVEDERWSHVGQNVMRSASKFASPDDWAETIELWYSEHENYIYPEIQGTSLNYIQIIWANTTNIGCGFIEYKTTDPVFGFQSLYICNYGPAGNIVGEAPYIAIEEDD